MLLITRKTNKNSEFIRIHQRRVPAADRFLGLRVRIPTVTCKACLLWILYVVKAEVFATGRSLVQRGLIVCECVTDCYQKQR